MEAIKIGLSIFEDCIFDCSPMPYEIDLLSKNTQFKVGYLLLQIQDDFSIPVSSLKKCANVNKPENQSKKRISNSFSSSSPLKQVKIVSSVNKPQLIPPDIPSTGVQPSADSFISINQNLTTGEKVAFSPLIPPRQ